MALIPKSQREQWRAELEAATPPHAHTVRMCNVDGCVYVSGHGGEHLPPDGSRDMSDEIRLRVLRDRCKRLQELADAVEPLLAENDELRRMVREMRTLASSMTGHQHWDHTMQHGAGCQLCITQREAMDRIAELAREVEE